MKSFALIVRRELFERRLFFAGAAIAGLMTLLVPLLPQLKDEDPIAIINFSATTLATTILFCGSFIVGQAIFGSDLAERRMSFFFARPFHTRAIWIGKIVAAVLIPAALALTIILPATFIGAGLFSLPWLLERVPGWRMLIFPVVILFLIGLGNHLGVLMRARSKWILLDFVAIPSFLLVGWLSVRPFFYAGAIRIVGAIFLFLLVVTMVSLLASGYAGFSTGRVDIRGVHKVSSMTFIVLLGVAIILVTAYSDLVRSSGPHDMATVWINQFTRGDDWVVIGGRVDGHLDYESSFVLNPASGQWVASRSHNFARVAIADNGSRIVSEKLKSLNEFTFRPVVMDFATQTRRTLDIEYRWSQASGGPEISPDGTRLAILAGNLLSIYSLTEDRLIATTKLREGMAHVPIWFVDKDTVRLNERVAQRTNRNLLLGGPNASEAAEEEEEEPSDEIETRILEFDVANRSMKVLGSYEGLLWSVQPLDGRVLVRNRTAKTFQVLDENGVPIREVAADSITLLGDGSIAWASIDKDRVVVTIAAQGEDDRIIGLGKGRYVQLGGEIENGRLVVMTSPEKRAKEWSDRAWVTASESRVLDTATGDSTPLLTSLQPVVWTFQRFVPRPGSARTKLFTNSDSSALIYVDPSTGEQRVVAGRGSSER